MAQIKTERLQELADEFCRRSDLAPKSRTWYRDMLRAFLPWAEEQSLGPRDLTPDVVDAYGRHLEQRRTSRGTSLAAASRRAYLRALRQFLSWLRERHGMEEVEPGAVQMPRLRKVHREVLSRQEIQRLEDAARSERDKLMIRLMADTGVREGGVASLRVDDLVQRDRLHFVRVRDKTGQRLPPIRPELYRRLKAYAQGRTGRPRSPSPYLFLSDRRPNGGGEHEPLTESGVYQAVKDAVARSELGRRIYPHLLRHSAITWMVSEGMHPALVSEITGVSVAVIASAYSHPSDEQRYAAMQRLWD